MCLNEGWKGSDAKIDQNTKVKISEKVSSGIRVKLTTRRPRNQKWRRIEKIKIKINDRKVGENLRLLTGQKW